MSDNKPWSELSSLKDLVVPRSEMNLPGFEGHFDGPSPERRLRNSVRPPDGDLFGNENVMPNPGPSPGPGPGPGPNPGPARSMNPFAAHGGAHTRGGFQPMAEPPPPPPRRFRNSNYSMNRRMQAEGSNYSQFQRPPLMPHGEANGGRGENDDVELRSIFLPGLDPATGHREVFEYFCRFGPLERVTVRRGKDGCGYAIVHFRNSGSMRSAIASNPHELRGRKVHCRSADKRDNRYKQKKQNGWNKNRGNQMPPTAATRQNMTRQKNKPPGRGRQGPGGNAAGGGPMGGNSAAGASSIISGNAAGASAIINGNAAAGAPPKPMSGNATRALPKPMSGNSGGASAPVPIDPDMPSTSTGIVSSGDQYTRFTRSMTARQQDSGPRTFAEPAKPSGSKNPFAVKSKPKPSADKPKPGADKSKPPTVKPKPGSGPKPKSKAKPRKAPRIPVVRLPLRRSERLRKRLLVKPAATAPRPVNPPQPAPPAPANPPQPRGENRARGTGNRRRPGAKKRRSATRGGGVKKTQRSPRWTMRLGIFRSEEEKKAYGRGTAPAAAELATPRTLRRSARKKEDSQSANSIKKDRATGERVDEPIGASGAGSGSGPLASPSGPTPPPPVGLVTPSGSHLVFPHPGQLIPATTPPPPVMAGSSQARSLAVPPYQVPYPPGSPSPLHQVVAGSSQARTSAGSLLGHLFSPSTPPPPVVAGASRAGSMASGSPSTRSHPGHLIAPYQVPLRSIPGHLMPPPLQATQVLAGSSPALSRSLGNVTPPESPQVLASSGHVIPPFFPQTAPPHILNSPTPQTPPNSSPQVDSPPFLQASEAIAPARVVVPDAVPVIPTWFELLQAINARGGGSPDSFPSSASSNALQIVTSPEQSLPSSPGSFDSLPSSNQVQPSHHSSGSSTSSNSLSSSPIPAGILPHPGLYSQALNVLTSPGTSARPSSRPSTSSGPGLLSLSNPNTAAMQPPRNRGSLPQPPQPVAARPAGFYLETLPSESSQDNGPPSRRRRVNDPRLAARPTHPGRSQPPQSVPVRGRPFSIPLPRAPLPHSLHPEPPSRSSHSASVRRSFGSKARFTLNCYTNVEGYRRSRIYVPLSEDEKKKRPTVKEFLEKQYTDEAVFISSEDLHRMHLDARNEFWRQAPNAEKWQNLKRIRQSFVSFAGPTDKESHQDENKINLPLYTVKLSVQESLEGVRSEGVGIREVTAVFRVLPILPQHCPIVASPGSGLISSISASAALGDSIILKKEDPEEEDAKPSVPIPDVSIKKEEMDRPDKVESLDHFVEPILWSPIPARIPKKEDSSSEESDYSIDFSSSEELAEETCKEEPLDDGLTRLDLSPNPENPQDLLEPEALEEYLAQLLKNYVSDPGSSDSSDSDDEKDYVSKTSRRPEAYPYHRNPKEEPLEDINDENRTADYLPKTREASLQTKLKKEMLMSPEEKSSPIPTTKSNEMEYKTESCHVRPTHGESFKYKGALSYHRLKCHLRRGSAVGTLLFDKKVKILSEKQGDCGAFDKKYYPIDVEDEEKEALEALDDEVIDKKEDLLTIEDEVIDLDSIEDDEVIVIDDDDEGQLEEDLDRKNIDKVIDKKEDLIIEVDEIIDLDSIEDKEVIVIDDDDEVQLEEDLDRKNIEKNRDHRDRDSDSPDSPEHLSQQTLRSLKEFKNWYDSFASNKKEIFKKNLRDLLVKMKQETGQDFKPQGSKVKLTLDAESFTEKMVVWAKSVNADISITIPKGTAAKGKKYPFQNEIDPKKRISVKATSLTDKMYNWARSLRAEITVEMPSNSFDDFLEGNPLKDNKDPDVFIKEEASQRDKAYPLKNRSHRQHPYQRSNKLAFKREDSPTNTVRDSSKFLNLKSNISKSSDSKDNEDPEKAHHLKNKSYRPYPFKKVQSTTNKIAIKKEPSHKNKVYGSVARFLDEGTTLQIRSDSQDNILKSKAEERGSFGCKPTEEKRAKNTRTKPYQKKPCHDVQKEKKNQDTSKRGALKDIEIEQAIIDGIYTFSISFKNLRRRYKRALKDGEKAGPAKRRKLH